MVVTQSHYPQTKKNAAAVDALRHFTQGTFQVALKYEKDYSYTEEQPTCFNHFIIGLTETDTDTFNIHFHMPAFKPNSHADHQKKIGNAWECLMRISEIERRRMPDIKTVIGSELAERLMTEAKRFDSTHRLTH